jgi:two-component system response regulator (stage 0 sporulation protein F)
MMNVLPILIVGAKREKWEGIIQTVRKFDLREIQCHGLHEALRLLARQDFGVIFCNDTLPDGDFQALLRESRKSTASAPVIALSRLGDWDSYLDALDAGAFDYITYPLDTNEAERILWAALRESSRHPHIGHATVYATAGR